MRAKRTQTRTTRSKMAVLRPEHLFEQADKLVARPEGRLLRQVDLRRAISAAYYGVFHYVLTAAADGYAGIANRNSKNYALAYRSVDHRALRDLCVLAKKPALSAKYQRYAPAKGLGPNIQAFASAFLELQEKRHSADYDPLAQIKASDARLAIATARSAIGRFEKASPYRRKAFLSLLLFPPR